jgi:DNA primase
VRHAKTKKLILTEAVIDAATLYQDGAITKDYSVLACYGTNGFTPEHEQAIKALRYLEEVILFFDGDEAGKEGAHKLAAKLRELRSDITLSQVNTPEGEEVNSLAQSHEKEIFAQLINARAILFSIEKKEATPANRLQAGNLPSPVFIPDSYCKLSHSKEISRATLKVFG